MPYLDVLLQDQATTKGALSLCAIPSRGRKVGKMAPEAHTASDRRKAARAKGGLKLWFPQARGRWTGILGVRVAF